MQDVFIISISRTPIGSLGGSLSAVAAPRLGAIAIKSALERGAVPAEAVEEVYMGNVLSANEGQAPANQASIFAGIPVHVPCTAINKVCASEIGRASCRERVTSSVEGVSANQKEMHQ